MINYGLIQSEVTSVMKNIGYPMTYTDTNGTTVKVYGIRTALEVSEAETINIGIYVSKSVGTFYCQSHKTPPAIGGSLTYNKVTYIIDEVEEYKPTNVCLAYKIVGSV